MQILKKGILLLSAFSIIFTSCEKSEDITEDNTPGKTQGQGQGEEEGQEQEGNGQETPEQPEAEALSLTLDLFAAIRSDEGENGLKYHFGETVSAVALIRSTGDDLIYLPVSMTRSEGKPQSVEVLAHEVGFGDLTADATKKWQLKLIIGGKWDAASKQIVFEAPSGFAPSEKKEAIVFDQPYVSSWQEIPTDEKGQFARADEEHTRVELEVTTPAITLTHHIVSCEAEADVAISKIKLHAESLAFGGYFDFSDPQALKTDQEPQWHTSSDAPRSLEMDFSTPITVKANGPEPTNDYIYLWAMPTQSENRKISVLASGRVNNTAKEEFTDLTLFDAEFPRPEGHQYPIDSKIRIEFTPEISGPITLTTVDEKKTLVANNKDKVTFVVMQSGVDVTAQCKIYKEMVMGMVDEVRNLDFTTNRPGRYEFYAEKDGQRSDKLVITATVEEAFDPDGNIVNGTLFCPNVSMTSGWNDVNKVGNGNSPQDGLLCWAAAASNLLQWWLDDFKKKGHDLPASVPYGPGKEYRLAIFDTFYNTWQNYMHDTYNAVRWFMEGGGDRWGTPNGSHPNKGGEIHNGGYFRGVLSKDLEDRLFSTKYVKEYGSYYGWSKPQDPELQKYPTNLQRFSHLVTKLLKQGPTALSIDSHELTLWGCEVENGLVTKVHITNSDDGGNARIATYRVAEKNDRIHLTDYPGKTNNPTEVIRLTSLQGYPF